MEAIGLNPIRLDRIGLDPIRVNAIKLGVPGAASGSDRPYIDPEVLASLVAVCICDGKSNDDPDRAVIKNLVDPDNPFVISNAAFKLNSGYGKYEVDFTIFNDITDCTIIGNKIINHSEVLFKAQYNYEIKRTDVESFNAKVENITKGYIGYTYRDNNGIEKTVSFTPETIKANNGIITLPKSYNTLENSTGVLGGLYGYGVDKGTIITQIPSHQGAFVTDGKDDLIASTKTVKEMLGGSSEITVVSMIHQIESYNSNISYTNYIRNDNGWIRNNVTNAGKTGIYGYSCKNNATNINNILGDKNDYATEGSLLGIDSVFSVVGRSDSMYLSKVAYYWTIIAKIALTTDQINQVISYFNLDKHVKPDIIYDTIRQGITNENHASFNDELVDFSGNGHNMKIYNSAWNKESGINDEGAWQTDGVSDYGKVTGVPIYKDYTVAADRTVIGTLEQLDGGVSAKCTNYLNGSFVMDYKDSAFSFGGQKYLIHTLSRIISYQSKYISNGKEIVAGNSSDVSDLYVGKLGIDDRYSAIALYSYLLFPYSLSEFLLERQLKKYKLGTLYPDMVEFRPIIKNNNQYRRIDFYTQSWDKKIYPGDYVPINSILRANIYLNNELNELQSFRINGVNVTFVKSSVDKTAYNIGNIPIAKSPQKIDITIDEYIRFEDIIQPYPAIVNLSQDGKSITWGDKLKVGSEVTFVNHTNLLPDLYTVSGGVQYNGTSISWNTSIRVEKSMVFVNPHSYKKANEPNCILAPQTLRIPNSSYKILGYIPDLTGKGNHGRLNNFAYTEESGANEDGSIRFDGTDDHIIIPTIKHGGKALLMKVNWRYKNNIAMAYDQRINWGGLGISISRDQLPLVAYKPYNKVTYIDGIKNESVLVQDLEGITHNITGIYDNLDLSDERDVCISRTSDASNSGFADMSMYEFMLFPDVPNEEEIKELNDIVGIENNIEVS
ncbi:hypothetical protein [Bacteroides finegoldii]|uniref:hypothetical protein n=1 Tax=Bacteroides finegoldii TaxID=338188 RepID=UPI0034A2B392